MTAEIKDQILAEAISKMAFENEPDQRRTFRPDQIEALVRGVCRVRRQMDSRAFAGKVADKLEERS